MSTDNSAPPAAPAAPETFDIAQMSGTPIETLQANLKHALEARLDTKTIETYKAAIAARGVQMPSKAVADDYAAHGLSAEQAKPTDYKPELGRGVDAGGRDRLNDLSASLNLSVEQGNSLEACIAEVNTELGKVYERDGAAGWDAWKQRMSAITERLVKNMPESVSHEELVTLAGKALQRSNTDLARRMMTTDIGQVMLRHPIILRTLAHIEIAHQRMQSRYQPKK